MVIQYISLMRTFNSCKKDLNNPMHKFKVIHVVHVFRIIISLLSQIISFYSNDDSNDC